ncbi:MAG: hypothetical protein KC418_05715 [Anaerolineales bacterium]|nr:hypothetical protein [Anaerolineales bacterium]
MPVIIPPDSLVISSTVSESSVRQAVHKALRNWRTIGGDIENLLMFLLVMHQAQRQPLHLQTPAMLRQTTNDFLESNLEILAQKNPIGAAIIDGRFCERKTMGKVAESLNFSEDYAYNLQRKALKELGQIIYGLEVTARRQYQYELEANLPYNYCNTRLFGVENARHQLTQCLLNPEMPPIVVLYGIGGIGKSSLACAVAQDIIQTFFFGNIIWLEIDGANDDEWVTNLTRKTTASSSTNELIAHPRHLLKANRYLVIIDNLETPEDLHQILATIQTFHGPSRFLLTSRIQPEAGHYFLQPLSDISFAEAHALLQNQMMLSSQHHTGDLLTVEEAQAIYNVVGGNPLALKLVAGLRLHFSAEHILAELKEAVHTGIAGLYHAIYWKAWHNLTSYAHRLLRAMTLIAPTELGGSLEQIQSISQLSNVQFMQAVTELITYSLLEPHNRGAQKRYSIHPITRTFLLKEVIRWSDDTRANASN